MSTDRFDRAQTRSEKTAQSHHLNCHTWSFYQRGKIVLQLQRDAKLSVCSTRVTTGTTIYISLQGKRAPCSTKFQEIPTFHVEFATDY
ncbi:hypothetical protein [Iningainema tapete]|uniref:Uncharacterized protein n=1 Tax=Iningainema tapete BLCC-T55 TaxID=2748662 RepID=A0A8J7BVW8_9CYAN|nr:hypothetical protein [Iningainema tapete]MBD2770687.1 hypothetical protein [Iningainema tapete BLCC-T55]